MARKYTLLAIFLLAVGVVIGQWLPKTFLGNPLVTLRLMNTLPIGSRVAPARVIQRNNLFRSADLEGDWLIVGYEALRGLDGETVVLCQVRVQGGAGPLLAVNPIWLAPVSRRIEFRKENPSKGEEEVRLRALP